MTSEKRLWITTPIPITFISLVLLITFLMIRDTPFPVEPVKESKTSLVPSPLKTPALPCVEVRTTKWSLEEAERIERKEKLAEIYALQRDYLIDRAESLFAQRLLSSEDLAVLQTLARYSETEDRLLSPFDQRYQDGEKVIKDLLDNGLIRRRLVQGAQSRGIALATSINDSEKLVLARPECFEAFEVDLIRKIRNPNVKRMTGWTQKQSPSDLVRMMASTLR